MPKEQPKGEKPIYKDFEGGLSLAVWSTNFVIQQRKNEGTKEKPDWQTVGTIKGNKKQAQRLAVFLIEGSSKMSYPEYEDKKPSKRDSNDD